MDFITSPSSFLNKLTNENEKLQMMLNQLVELAKAAVSDDGKLPPRSPEAIVRITTLQNNLESWIQNKKRSDRDFQNALEHYDVALRNSIAKGERLSQQEVNYLEQIREKDYLMLRLEAEMDAGVANKLAQEDIRQLNKDKRNMSAKLEEMLDKYQHLTAQYDALKAQTGRQQGFTTVTEKLGHGYDDEGEATRPQSGKRKRNNNHNNNNSSHLFVPDEFSMQDLNLSDNAESNLANRRRKSKSRPSLVITTNPAQRNKNEPFAFSFTAIMSYDENGNIAESKSSNVFKESLNLTYILDRISIVLKWMWIPGLGDADVCFLEFELDHDAGAVPRCITSAACGRNTNWASGSGAEKGKYACKDCVEKGLPCFMWGHGGLRMLPFHPEERPRQLIATGHEAWYWVNLDIDVADPGERDVELD